MATNRQAADKHRLATAGLSIVAVGAIERAFAYLDMHNLRGTMPAFTTAIAAIVRHYAPASSVLAIRHYTEQRLEAGVSGSFRPKAADPVPLEQVASAVHWATQPLWGPPLPPRTPGGTVAPVLPALPGGSTPATPATPTVPKVTPPASTGGSVPANVEDATARLEAAVERLIENTGRSTTIDNVEADRTALGWAREARPDACWFCAMLATRGAVYKTAESAGQIPAPDGMPTDSGFANRYHNNCHCQVVPVFNAFEKQAHVRDWTALWNDSTRDVTGMEAKQAAFREAYKKFQAERAAAADEANN